jgi:hypothetical protein
MSGEVVGLDGLTDQQREGARLAAAGWRGVDIAEHLDVAPETVSRWRKKPEYVAAIEAILSEARSEVAGRMVELTDKALDVVEQTLEHPFDRALKLRAAVALLQVSGIGRAMQTGTTRLADGKSAESRN